MKYLIRTPEQRDRCARYILELDLERPIEVTAEPYKTARSAQQNARYWVLITRISQDMPAHMGGEWHSPETWHELFKKMFLGMEGIDINGVTYGAVKSSRKLKVDEFGDFMTQVEAWAGEHGIGLE